MNVKITRWQPLHHEGKGIASFNFRVGEITIRAAMFLRRGDSYDVTMPFTSHRLAGGRGLTAVGLDHDLYHAVIAAATNHYNGLQGHAGIAPAEPDDSAGLMRMLGAEHETCERAGL